MEKDDVDFVITWVDGTDEEWIKDKEKYSKKRETEANSQIRFRDWGTLKYWFRAVEKFTPWVNNIFFVTYGHIPDWLNTENPRLKIVKHEDYIPNEYLPTFNANVLEIYMNRIPNLAGKFVYFNDDMFIANYMKKEDFFKDEKVKDMIAFNSVSVKEDNNIAEHLTLNDLEIISKYYNKKTFIKNNLFKVFNLKYGKLNIKSILLLPWKYFTGIENPHMPTPLFKKTFETIWEREEENFKEMSSNKFRTKNDYNQWLFRYWQLFDAKFIPTSTKKCKFHDLEKDNTKFLDNMKKYKYDMVCINDSDNSLDFEKIKEELVNAFEEFLPEKSSFEK